MSAKDLTAKDLGSKSGVGYRTIENWLSSRDATPRADFAVSVACVLGTTVEYLVSGDIGSEYVRGLVESEGSMFRAPPRIAGIVEDLDRIDDVKLETLKLIVRAMAGEAHEKRALGS